MKNFSETPQEEQSNTENKESLPESLKERLGPQFRKLRTYAAMAGLFLGAEQGINTGLRVEEASDIIWNPLIETVEDMRDDLHKFGMKDELAE